LRRRKRRLTSTRHLHTGFVFKNEKTKANMDGPRELMLYKNHYALLMLSTPYFDAWHDLDFLLPYHGRGGKIRRESMTKS
jgi:hypothetical protein